MRTLKFDDLNYIHYNHTAWDQKVLKYKTNEIVKITYTDENKLKDMLSNFEDICYKDKFYFTSIRVDVNEATLRKALSKQGYINIETSLLVERKLGDIRVDKNIDALKFDLMRAKKEDEERLKVMTCEMFNYGRFFEDPLISEEKARERNKNWIVELTKNSNVLVGKIGTIIFGFMAFKIDREKVILQLGGLISSHYLFAYPFWYRILVELRDNYCTEYVSGLISASNIRVLNLYSYFGFKFTKAYFGYHKHR